MQANRTRSVSSSVQSRAASAVLIGALACITHDSTGQCEVDSDSLLEYKMPPWPEAVGTVWGDMNADGVVDHNDYAAFIKLAATCSGGPNPSSASDLIQTANTFTDLLFDPPTPPGTVTIDGDMSNPYAPGGGQQEYEELCNTGDLFEGVTIVFNENLGRAPTKAEIASFRVSNDPGETENPCDDGGGSDPELPTDGQPDFELDPDEIQCASDLVPSLPDTTGGVCDTPPTGPDVPDCPDDGTDCGTIITCASENPNDCNPTAPSVNIPEEPGETAFPYTCAMEASEQDMEDCVGEMPSGDPDELEDSLFGDGDEEDEDRPIFYSSEKGPGDDDDVKVPDDPSDGDENQEGTGDDDDDGGADDCGPGSEGEEGGGETTPKPVDLLTGEKRELSQVDMRIKLPGPDFKLRRNYDGTLVDNLLGPGWRLDAFMWASTTAPTDGGVTSGTPATRPHAPGKINLMGVSPAGRSYSFWNYEVIPASGTNTYYSSFGGDGYMTLDSVTGVGVYAFDDLVYHSPSHGTVEFERMQGTNEANTILFVPKYMRDNAGNVREYDYFELPFDNSDNLTRARLETINFYTGVGPTETPDPDNNSNHTLVAKVRFRWHLVLGDSRAIGVSPIQGQLASVVAYRPDTANPGSWIETQQVDYTYKWDWDRFSPEVSENNGSLIQVRRHVLMDSGWTGTLDINGDGTTDETSPAFPHTSRITQYRYHTATDAFHEMSSSGDDRFTLDAWLENDAGPLKMVIEHDAFESMARWWAGPQGVDEPAASVRIAAFECLMLNDDEIAYEENFANPITLVDMASKVIGYSTTTGSREVTEQYLQGAGCGCGGGSMSYRRFTYDYTDLVLTSDRWRSTKVSEYVDFDDGNGEVLYREHFYDLYSPTLSQTYLQRKFDAVIEYNSSATAVRKWVTEYVHDDRFQSSPLVNRRGNLLAIIPPGTMDSGTYKPIDPLNSDPPDCDRRVGDQLARVYDYNTDGRLIAVKLTDIDDVDIPTASINAEMPGTVIRRDFYEDTLKPHLLTKREWYTGTTTTADTTRVVRFNHTFSGDRLMKIERYVESPETGEGGPASSQGDAQSLTAYSESDVYYKTVYGFDEQENLIAIRSPDGLITKIDRDDQTGMATSITRNFQGTIALDGSTNFDAGVTNSLSAIEKAYELDALGRLKVAEIPITMESGFTNATEAQARFVRTHRTISGLPMLPFDEGASITSLAYPCVISLPNQLSGGDFDGPAVVTWMFRDGRPLATAEFVLGLNGITGDPYASTVDPFDDLIENSETELVGLMAYEYDRANNLTKRWVWRDIASDSYDETSFEYDALGRLAWVQDPTGDRSGIGRYDGMDRPLTYVHAIDDGSGVPTTPIVTRSIVRDFDTLSSGDVLAPTDKDGGNGWTYKIVDHLTGSPGHRVTEFKRDQRGRITQVLNPAAPHQVISYNNQDEPVKTAEYGLADPLDVPSTPDSTSELSSRSSYLEVEYNQRGHVFSVKQAFDTTASAPSEFKESRTWFDSQGRTIAEATTGSPAIKLAYDVHGRMTQATISDIGSDPLAMGYVEASDATGDTVFEQYEQAYSAAGLPLLTTSLSRLDSASATDYGPLASSNSVTTYDGVYFDEVGRPIAAVNFGTNDSNGDFIGGTYAPSAPTWPPASVPAASGAATELVTAIEYDDRGRLDQVLDPEEIRTKIWYDDSGRRVAVTENFAGPSGSTAFDGYDSVYGHALFTDLFENDDERTTGFVYDGAGRIIYRVAYLPSSQYQITQYDYGVIDGDRHDELTRDGLPNSNIDSQSLLSRVIYPDESTGLPNQSDATAQRLFAYNRQGELIGLQDQNQTVHVLTRDELGRVTTDTVDIDTGSNVDPTVATIETVFDLFGRVDTVSSESATPTTLNQVKFVYTAAGLIEEFIQEPDGAVKISTSPRVTYEYEDGETGEGTSGRVTSVTYPTIETGLASTLSMYYGAATLIDDRMSRLIGMDSPSLTGSSDELLRYDYLGYATPIRTSYPVPGVSLDRKLAGDGSSTDAKFPGLDLFGRIARHTWADDAITQGTGGDPSIPPIIDRVLGYSKASDLIHDLDGRPGASGNSRDRLYEHDDLHRLVKAELGKTVDLDTTQFTSGPFTEQWTLDTLGNWSAYGEDTDGNGTLTLFDGEYNEVNELDRRFTGADRSYELEYDDNGNMTKIRRRVGSGAPYAYSDRGEYIYDAWNRLVEAKRPVPGSSPAAVGEYEYNGLGYRVKKRVDNTRGAPNGLDEERDYFYTPAWQLIEEHVDEGLNGSVERIAQQFWGGRYIDDSVARRIDHNADEDFSDADDTLYFYLTDRQFSVSALIREDGDLAERIEYSPYGLARRVESPSSGDPGQQLHGYNEDVNGDGAVDSDDAQEILDILPSNFLSGGHVAMGDPDYEVRLDINQDGKIDFFYDYGPVYNNSGLTSPPSGWISDPDRPSQDGIDGPDNPIGYTGHVFDPETGFYLARNRHYMPEFGRWAQRDPLGYVDGMGLYEYVASLPLRLMDPYGLEGDGAERPGFWRRLWLFVAGDQSNAGPGRTGDARRQDRSRSLGGRSSTNLERSMIDAARDSARSHERMLDEGGKEAAEMSRDVVFDTVTGGSTSGLLKAGALGAAGAVRYSDEVVLESGLTIKRLSQLRSGAKTHQHHLFVQAAKEFFERRGLNVDDFVVTITREHHEAIHSGKGWGWYGDELMKLIKTREMALDRILTKDELLKLVEGMKERFGLDGLEVHRYNCD